MFRFVNFNCPGGGLPVKDPKDLYSFSHLRNATRLEDDRIGALRSAGSTPSNRLFVFGTVAEQLARLLPNVQERTADSGNTSFSRPAARPPIAARIGLGLPLSNIYATYFGGYCSSAKNPGTDIVNI